jgi:hypothetical protein
MTIKQLLENSIEIEGKVTVRQYDYKLDIYKTLHSTTYFSQEHYGDFMDMEIKFIYSVEEDGEGWLVIEVE